jgi:hypothetical protein
VNRQRLFIVPLLIVSLFHLITHVGIYHVYEDHMYEEHLDLHSHVSSGASHHNDHADEHHADSSHNEDPLNADANHCIAGLLHLSEIVSVTYSPKGVLVPEGLVIGLTVNPITTDLIASVGRAPPTILV